MLMVILGKRGQGKSTYLKNLIGDPRLLPSFLLYDTMGEHDGPNYLYSLPDLIAYWKAYPDHGTRGYRATFRPRDVDWSDEGALEYCCKLIYAVGNLAFIVEEVDVFSTAHKCPLELAKLINYGRHRNVSLVTTARRASYVPRLLTSQATDFVIFQMIEPRDIDWCSAVTGEDMSALRTLEVGEYLHWHQGHLEQKKTQI